MAFPYIFVFALVLGLCECGYVDTLTKCHLKDKNCLMNLIENSLKDVAETGIPEHNVPPSEPTHLKNLKVSILNVFNLTLVEGIAKGIKNCKVNKFKIDIEKRKRAFAEITCDLVVTGKYKLSSDSEQVKALLGGPVEGDGNGKVTVDQLHLKFSIPCEVVKRDGDIYFSIDLNSVDYQYDILGNLQFEADKLYVGDKESSKDIVKLLNENWKIIGDSFGKPVLEAALPIALEGVAAFIKYIPPKYYILDDLEQYIKT